MSSSWAIFSSFMRRARSLARTRCCLAAMQRMWSSKVNTELRRTVCWLAGWLELEPPHFLMEMRNERLSSLSGATSTFCTRSENLTTPQPIRLTSGSTRMNWMGSMTRNRRSRFSLDSLTVHAIRSLVFRSRASKQECLVCESDLVWTASRARPSAADTGRAAGRTCGSTAWVVRCQRRSAESRHKRTY